MTIADVQEFLTLMQIQTLSKKEVELTGMLILMKHSIPGTSTLP